MYETITRKTNVVETILRNRFGYIPKKITNEMLIAFEQRCYDPFNDKLMGPNNPIKKQEIPKDQKREWVRSEGITR